MSRFVAAPAGFEQKPRAALSFIDPDLDQARRRNVAELIDHVVHLAQPSSQSDVVFAKLGEHVQRIDVIGVIVLDALNSRDVSDRAQGRTAGFSDAFGDGIGHRVQLIGLFVQQQMVVAEMWSAHVPMKVLGLEIKRKYIGKDRVHAGRDILGSPCA